MKQNSAGKILRNSYWYTIEMVLETAIFLGSNVAVARYLGPVKLGHFAYINFLLNVVQRTGGGGLSMTTRKYVSEYAARDEMGIAHAVYRLSSRYQFIYAAAVVVLGCGGILKFGDPSYRTMSCILVASILPGLMSLVPAQTNQALEDTASNTISAFGYLASYLVVVLLTLHYRWDLIGLASATLIGRTVESVWRVIMLRQRFRGIPAAVLDQALRKTMARFCLEAIGLQMIMMCAYDRTELFFLRAFSSVEQIAFYSVSMSLASNLLIPSRVLSSSTGATLMVEASRDPLRVASIVRNACTYILVSLLPIMFGAAAIASPVIHIVYGTKYLGAVPVLSVAAIMGIVWAFNWIPDTLLRVADKQKRLLLWIIVAALLNALADYILIRRFGALGAAWGSGLGNICALIFIWVEARKSFTFYFPTGIAFRVLGATLVSTLIAYRLSHLFAPLPGVSLAVPSAVVSYIVLLRIFRVLDGSDLDRLRTIGNRLPRRLKTGYEGLLKFLIPSVVILPEMR